MKNWFLVAIWAGLIFLGSCLPGVRVSEFNWLDFLAHKIVHLFEYGILAFLLARALGAKKSLNFRVVLAVLAICFLYGLSDEWHQSFTFGREAKLRDAFIDLLGGFLGILLLWKLPPKVRRKLLN